MRQFVFVIFLAFHHCAFSQYSHDLLYVVGCFYNGTTTQIQFEFDEDLGFYVDFQTHEVIFTTPTFVEIDTSQFKNLYRNALRAKEACLSVVTIMKGLEDNPPEEKDPPESILYPAEEVQIGVQNHLICFVNHFFPPFIKVKWTKNNSPVSVGVSFSQYYPNNDQTFHYFSILAFTPKQGDVYSCTVEHSALDTPKTRIWDVDLSQHSNLDRALDFYCGVGLTVAFLGVAIGTYLIIKGRYCQL